MGRFKKGVARGACVQTGYGGSMACCILGNCAFSWRTPSLAAGGPGAVSSTRPALDPYEPIPPNVVTDAELVEFGTARSDHLSLALMILNRCFSDTNNPMKWSTQIKSMLLLGLNGHLGHDPVPSGVADDAAHLTLKNWFQGAALSYSDRLSRDRLYYQRILYENRQRAVLYQAAIAIVAAFATVLVGIKAIWPENIAPFWRGFGIFLGISALVASASVTALTTLNGFYGSQDEALRDQRTVGQLKQLHWRIINDAEFDRNLCIDERPPEQSTEAKIPSSTYGGEDIAATIYKDQVAKVASWKQRHEEILNDALPTLAKTGDLARPGDLTKPIDQTQAGPKPKPPGA